MKEFWNERYAEEEYVYGLTPNLFIKKYLDDVSPGTILFPADGEGRNSVYAAEKDWAVSAFDYSKSAKIKAQKLANLKNVKLNYLIEDFNTVEFNNEFDAVALIYAHFLPENRKIFHSKAVSFLKKGGVLILEAFLKEQINNNSGGPKSIDMLYDVSILKEDFKDLHIIHISSEAVDLNEGEYHLGKANVVRLIANKS